MSLPSDDLADIFAAGEFTKLATFGSATFYGHFQEDYIDWEGIEGKRPVFVCQATDAQSVPRGTVGTIDGRSLKHIRPEVDTNTGIGRMILEQQ